MGGKHWLLEIFWRYDQLSTTSKFLSTGLWVTQVVKIWTANYQDQVLCCLPQWGIYCYLIGMYALYEIGCGFQALNLDHKVCITSHLVTSVYSSLC